MPRIPSLEHRWPRGPAAWAAMTLLVCIAASPPLPAQDGASASELFLDSVDVHVVNLEVIVSDEDGNPVTGLTRDDFEVFEDGKAVEVTNFFAVEGRQAAAVAERVEDASSQGPEPETRSLFLVVFVDNLNTRPESRNRAFGSLRAFLRSELDARDRVMIVALNDTLRIEQTFTGEVVLIEATLDRLEKQIGLSVSASVEKRLLMRQIQRARLASRPLGANADMTRFDAAQQEARQLLFSIRTHVEKTVHNVRATVGAIQQFSGSLAGLRGRKAILYVSDGIPARPGEDLVQAWSNKFERWAATNNATDVSREMVSLPNIPEDVSHLLRGLAKSASAQRVAFYPISNVSQHGVGQVSAELAGATTSDGSGAFSRDVVTLDAVNRESSLLAMADGTGGLAFTRSSNLAGLLGRVVNDFSTFYSLGYTPLNPGDGEFHDVDVTVRRPGLHVRHVGGYRELDPTQKMENLTLSSLYYDFEDNPLGIQLTTGQQNETVGGQYRVPLLITFPLKKVVLLPQEKIWAGQIQAFVVVQDEQGDLSPIRRISLPIRIPQDRYEEAQESGGGYQMELVMRKGQHRIAVGLWDELADVESAVNLDIGVGLGRDRG